jgi:hypothetical protein
VEAGSRLSLQSVSKEQIIRSSVLCIWLCGINVIHKKKEAAIMVLSTRAIHGTTTGTGTGHVKKQPVNLFFCLSSSFFLDSRPLSRGFFELPPPLINQKAYNHPIAISKKQGRFKYNTVFFHSL